MTYFELLSFFITFNNLTSWLGKGITRFDFLVLGLSTMICVLPSTLAEYDVLLIVSRLELKSISSQVNASNSPSLIPVYKQIV